MIVLVGYLSHGFFVAFLFRVLPQSVFVLGMNLLKLGVSRKISENYGAPPSQDAPVRLLPHVKCAT